MEISNAPGVPLGLPVAFNRSAIDAVDRMDIDMDIDLGPIDERDAFQPSMRHLGQGGSQVEHTGTTAQEPQADAENPVPHKIHIRGLDDLTTDHINAFTAEHFPSDEPTRIEWIDDTSANIVFSTPAVALKALDQLTHYTHPGSIPELQLRPAKDFSANPDSRLEVRLALATDQKRPRAYEASRFYMMHPELDPREQRRKERGKQGRTSDHRRPKYGQDEHRRRRRDDRDQGFDPTMYDDDANALAGRIDDTPGRRDSVSMHSTNSSEAARSLPGSRPRYGRRGGHFRANARDRSASPRREGDDQVKEMSSRSSRRRTPPHAHDSIHGGSRRRGKSGKDLFPSKVTLNSASNADSRELFPNKHVAANLKKELFPSKSSNSHHRRSDAFDAADETADLFAKRLGFANGSLAAKSINVTESSYGRLNSDPSADSTRIDSPVDDGISIRGASKQHDQGISIRGVAADGTRIGTIKELFPGKAGGNAGKELFAERLQGRGGKRNRAEDMFY